MIKPVENFKDGWFSVFKRQKLGMRAFWLILYYFVAAKLPNAPLPASGFAMKLRLICIKKIFKYMGVDVTVHADVSFGSGVNVEIGNYSSLNYGCSIGNDTIIGRDVMMGPEVVILSGSHNFSSLDVPMREQGAPVRKPVIIGDDVWIGTRSIILPGVKVGSHSIIGAGSIVTRDVPIGCIVAGNPAKFIRNR